MIIKIENEKELKQRLKIYKDGGFLFRGQIDNYYTEEYPFSFKTSFDRIKCNPNFQFTWTYYCESILRSLINQGFVSELEDGDRFKYIGALMQHYGWRSQFIDLSSDPYVSLFFAGHRFQLKPIVHMTEDCYENFVIELKYPAEYHCLDEGYGYLYIIDKKKLEELRPDLIIDLHDGLSGRNFRPLRQKGFLLDNCDNNANWLMNECIVEVLSIKKSIIGEVCRKEEISVDYLFPSNDIDLIYDSLLSLPRKAIFSDNKDFPCFRKIIKIPEYAINYKKFQSPNIAYYSSYWIKDIVNDLMDSKKNNPVEWIDDYINYRCKNEQIFYINHNFELNLDYSNLINILNKHSKIFIEFDFLFKYHIESVSDYQKGFLLDLKDNIIMVQELGVEHVGTQLEGVYVNMPRYYEIVNQTQLRPIRMKDDCPCNDDKKHNHLIIVGMILFDGIASGYYKCSQCDEITYDVVYN